MVVEAGVNSDDEDGVVHASSTAAAGVQGVRGVAGSGGVVVNTKLTLLLLSATVVVVVAVASSTDCLNCSINDFNVRCLIGFSEK